MSEADGRILIDSSIDTADFDDAQNAALEVEAHISRNPNLVAEVLLQARPILEKPDAPPEWLEQTGSPDDRQEVARSIARLLLHTSDGSFLDFDDATYAILQGDSSHQQMVEISRNADHRHAGNPRINRRRVALSGLSIFVRTWGNREPAQSNKDEVA